MSGRHLDGQDDVLREDTDATTGADAETVLHEERPVVSTHLRESGRVRVAKHVESYDAQETVAREVEHAEPERVAAVEGDTGQVETLADGSVSIPVFEEVLVVTKKLVVRERIVVRKHTVVDEHVLRTTLQREHVSVEADDGLVVEDRTATSPRTGESTEESAAERA